MIEEKKHEHNFLFCEENDYKLYQGKMQDVLDTFQEESVGIWYQKGIRRTKKNKRTTKYFWFSVKSFWKVLTINC